MLILVIVFVGFARTYYLAGVFKAPLPNLLIHIPEVVFSSWILLLGHAHLVGSTDMLLFATPIYFAFCGRSNPPAHKRLILIATITLVEAAFVRWPIRVAWWDLQVAQIYCYPLLLLLVGYDLLSRGRIHRVTLRASVFLILLQQARFQLGEPPPGRASQRGCTISPVLSAERRNNRHACFADGQTSNTVKV